jgi:hypothetical protein
VQAITLTDDCLGAVYSIVGVQVNVGMQVITGGAGYNYYEDADYCRVYSLLEGCRL